MTRLLPENIYAVVRSIPRGKVATYGEVAGLAGTPTGHRQVARAMRSCPERLPWQRVVGKRDARRAMVNIEDPDHASLQRGLLESEGVVFDASACISLQRFGWLWASELGGGGAARPGRTPARRSGAGSVKRPASKPARRGASRPAQRGSSQPKERVHSKKKARRPRGA